MKTTTIYLMMLAAVTTAVYGQTTKPAGTYFGQHRIGETFQEWLAVTKLNPIRFCVGNAALFLDMKCESPDEQNGDFMTQDGTLWTVEDGKIAEIDVSPFYDGVTASDDAAKQVAILTAKYGKPAASKTVTYQNAFGAIFHFLQVDWYKPDGAEIEAGEYLHTTGTRDFIVRFRSAEKVKAIKAIHESKTAY